MEWLLSVFSVLANNRVSKITHSSFEVVSRATSIQKSILIQAPSFRGNSPVSSEMILKKTSVTMG
jgi:hypothetical protein